MSDMINEIVTKEAEDQLIRVTKLLKENMDNIKAHEALLRSATSSSGVRKATDELTKANEDFSKSEKEIIALYERRRTLMSEQAKQIAEIKAENKSLLESRNKQAALDQAERNSLERAQKLILLYTNEKKKLNLATEEGARLNENYNKAIQKANDFIMKNADAETKRAKNVGNYASSLAPLFNNLAASIKQAEISVKNYTKTEGDQGPNTQKAIQDLNALKNVFSNVATQAAIAGQTQEGFIAATKSSLTSLQTAGMTNTTIYADLTNGLSNSITPTAKAAGGFNALSNSITQITREAPAFVNSVQTGFMAISNNLPSLFDAVQSIRAQNAAAKEEAMAAATAQGFLAKEQAIAGGASEEAADKIKEQVTAMALSSAEGVKGKGVLKQLATSFFSLSTLISLGITLLTVYGKDIFEFFKTMVKGTEAMDEFAEKQKMINEAYKDTSVKDAVKNVLELGMNIKLAKNNMADKEAVVQQYNDTIGKTAGLVTTLDEAEKGLTANGDAYIKMTLFKAAANLAMEESAKKVLEAEQLRQKNLEEFAKIGDRNLVGTAEREDTYENKKRMREANEKAMWDARKKRQADEIKSAEQTVESQKKVAEALNKKASDEAKLMGGQLLGDKSKAAKDQEKANKEAERASTKAESNRKKDLEQQKRDAEELAKAKEEAAKKVFDANYELKKKEYEIAAENAKDIQDNEEKSLNDRLRASSDYYTNLQNIQDLELSKELFEAENNEEAKKAIVEKYGLIRIQLVKDIAAKRAVIIKSANDHELELALKALDKEKEKYDQYSLEALRELDEEYSRGLMSHDQYEKQRAYISQMAMQNSLRAQLDFAQKKLDSLKLEGGVTIELEKKISELRQKIAEGDANIYSSIHTENKKNAEDTTDAWASAAQSTIQLINNITDALARSAERQADIKKKRVDEDEKRELDSLDRRALSSKQKEEEKLRIELAADDKRKVIDREKVSRLRKYAAVQKAADIANIISGTALAVVNALKTQPTYLGIALALGVGIAGAAQLAAAVASPLPQYAKGRKGGKAEFALVGEAGAEIIDTPGEAPRVVDRPTITWLKEGASVIPTNEALMKSLFAPTMNVLANNGKPVTTDSYGKAMIESFEKEIGGLKKVIQQNRSSVNIYGDSGVYVKNIIG